MELAISPAQMTRKTTIYWAAPAFTLLSCMPNLQPVLPPLLWGALFLLLVVLSWGIVWMRLYTSQLLRAEFSLLAVLPFLCFGYLTTLGEPMLAQLSTAGWQNAYFMLWIVALYISIRCLSPTKAERSTITTKLDRIGVIMKVLSSVYMLSAWATTANILYHLS